jgi:branched-chain amino acid aminotransferase
MAAGIDTLKANKMPAAYIRPIVFVGSGVSMGVNPGGNPIRVAIAVWPWGAYLGPEALERGIRIRTSSFTRYHVNSMMTKAKAAGNYVNSVLAKTEALADGFDEAMMLDAAGYVAEGSGENIFIVKNGVIKTPPLTTVLAGITRDSLLSVCADLGYTVKERFSPATRSMWPTRCFQRHGRRIDADSRGGSSGHRRRARRTRGQGPAGRLFKVVKGENPKYAHCCIRTACK